MSIDRRTTITGHLEGDVSRITSYNVCYTKLLRLRGVPPHGTDVSHFFSQELLLLRVHNNLARISSRVVKRLFDILVSSCLLLLLSPA